MVAGRGGRSFDGMPTAIVTGASRGLGLALARALAERGWRLVIDAREAGPLNEVATELALTTDVAALAGDVADPEHRAALSPPPATGRPARQQRLACSGRARSRRSPTTRSTRSSTSTASTSSRRWR